MTSYPPFGQDLILTIDLLLIVIVSIYCMYIYSTDLSFGPETSETKATDVENPSENNRIKGDD